MKIYIPHFENIRHEQNLPMSLVHHLEKLKKKKYFNILLHTSFHFQKQKKLNTGRLIRFS